MAFPAMSCFNKYMHADRYRNNFKSCTVTYAIMNIYKPINLRT